METTAEKFLREKLESEISSFGDGTMEFHTRDIEHLLKCLDDKDEQITQLQTPSFQPKDLKEITEERKWEDIITDDEIKDATSSYFPSDRDIFLNAINLVKRKFTDSPADNKEGER